MRRPTRQVSELALSQTHRHLLSIINTELSRRSPASSDTIRLLDVGCGDGRLLLYLLKALPACWPDLQFDFHGFDVGDHGMQEPGFLLEARERLEQEAPGLGWNDRIRLISEHDPWPFSRESFDVIVSNQVLEHVRDQRLFFDQIATVMKPTGFAAHIFPSAHCFVEPHLRIPFAHKVRDAALLQAWITFWSRIGVSNYRSWAQSRASLPESSTITDYARIHAEFLIRLTNFRTQKQLLAATKESQLLATFRYTGDYFSGKLRNVMGRDMRLTYSDAHPYRSCFAGLFLRHVTSVTLLLYSRQP